MPKPGSQSGFSPIFLLLVASLGVIIYLLVASILPFKDKLFYTLFPKPPSHAASLPIVFKSASGEILPTNASGVSITTSPTIKIELTSTLGSPVASSSANESTPSAAESSESASENATSSAITSIPNTKAFRIAESSTDLDKASLVSYTVEPTVIDYTFKNTSPGSKVIWVDFMDTTDKLDRKAAQIELISSTPTSTSSATPSSTSTPSSTPTATPKLALTPVSTLKPSVTTRPTPTPTEVTAHKSAAEIIKERNSVSQEEPLPTPETSPEIEPSFTEEESDCGVFCNISNFVASVFENILKRFGLGPAS